MTTTAEEVQTNEITERAKAAYGRLAEHAQRDVLFIGQVRSILGVTHERTRQLLKEGKLQESENNPHNGKWERWMVTPAAVKDFIDNNWAQPRPQTRKRKKVVILEGGDAAT